MKRLTWTISASPIAAAMRAVICSVMITAGMATGAAASDGAAGLYEEIESALTTQERAWNSGDLDGYMAAFWRSNDVVHIFNGDIETGFDAIRLGIERRNPDPEKYGNIAFHDLNVTPLGEDVALAHAPWTYSLGDMRLAGVFTLVFQKIDERWLIIHDHSTVTPVRSE